MATIRRLSDDDVRAVFECVHNNTDPPSHLPFQIVPVGSDGLKLSPPSFKFEDGLYILLKPQQKKNSVHSHVHPKVPSKLMDYVMLNVPETNCPWSLSGPQFPQPTAIQQRYCYPKGDPEYSSQKGGALWTMYGTDGREDLEYRLLHVYFSAKRAVNKGVKVECDPDSTSLPNAKRLKRTDTPPLVVGLHSFETLSIADSFNDSTSDSSDCGRFHPIPVNSNNSSPEHHDVVHPWIHLPSSESDAYRPDLDEQSSVELMRCWEDATAAIEIASGPSFPSRIHSFALKMEQIHESIKECIMNFAPASEQGHLVSLVSSWAKQVAASPLGSVNIAMEEV